jgi:hypothetical protein
MFRFWSTKRQRAPNLPLNETQQALVARTFEMLRLASFGFTQDRLLHLQEENLKVWTDGCTDALRRNITAAAPSHIKITLIDFLALRCVSLQCRSLGMPAAGGRPTYGLEPPVRSVERWPDAKRVNENSEKRRIGSAATSAAASS